MILTDTHAHLYASQFDDDRNQVIENAIASGVERMFLPNIDSTSIDGMLALSDAFSDHCFPMMGIHPCSIAAGFESELQVAENWLSKKAFYAIGEIGIDLYWDKTTLSIQEEAFRTQVNWAKKFQLPIVIHCRDSFHEVTRILDALYDDRLRGVFHCFTGTMEDAEKIMEYGTFKIGLGGVATFKNGGLKEVIPKIPMHHVVLETDAPYLSPVPFRGKRNESSYLVYIAEVVAELYGISMDELASITTNNSMELFGK